MIVFPNSKINIGLHVLNRRVDGFHNIESVFYPISWKDSLETVKSEEFLFEVFGSQIAGTGEENLCIKAYRLLQQNFDLPNVKMCLLKNIPAGAGLGGGSSDGAFTLKLLNDIFSLNLSSAELKSLSTQLGSDCSFFIENKPCFVSGRGDQLQLIDLDLTAFHIVLVHPNISINTKWAYEQLAFTRKKINDQSGSLSQLIKNPIQRWKEILFNDFEEVVFLHHPEIALIKQQFYDNGAIYASMSGSGSAVYGIFEHEPMNLSFKREWKIFSGKL